MIELSGAQPGWDTNQVTGTTIPIPVASQVVVPNTPRSYASPLLAQGVAIKTREITVGTSPKFVAIAPSGKIFVTNSGSGTLSVIDPLTWTVVATITVGSTPLGICYATSTDRMYAVCADSKLYVIDPAAFTVVGTITLQNGQGNSVCWVPTQNCLYVGFSGVITGVQQITSLTSTGGSAQSLLTTTNTGPLFVIYAPTKDRVYSLNDAGPTISAINPTTNAVFGSVTTGGGTYGTHPISACYCPYNDRIYVCCAGSGTSKVLKVNPITNVIDAEIAMSQSAVGVAYHPKNKLVYVVSASSALFVVNPTNDTVYQTQEPTPNINCNQPAFSPHTGMMIIPYSTGGTVAVYT